MNSVGSGPAGQEKCLNGQGRRLYGPLWAAAIVAGASLSVAGPVRAEAPGHGRHYELATPAEKAGQPTVVKGLSNDGSTVRFIPSAGGLPGTEGQNGALSSYVGRRVDGRWDYFPMSLPVPLVARGLYLDATPSLDLQLFRGTIDEAPRTTAFFVRRPGMLPEQVSLPLVSRGVSPAPRDSPKFAGSSLDLKHIVFTAPAGVYAADEVSYLASDPPPEPGDDPVNVYSPQKLYESVAGSPPVLRRVDVGDDGVPIGTSCMGQTPFHADLGTINLAERAVSADGGRIFFTVSPDCVERRLYARLHGQTTVELSTSECDRVADPGAMPPITACASRRGSEEYESASADGRFVFFTSPNQLSSDDVDEASDLYRYDFDAPRGARLRKISRRNTATPEVGADLRGVVRAAGDGRSVYFIAGAPLQAAPNAQGDVAIEGGSNLYRYEEGSGGSLQFVVTLSPSDDSSLTGPLRSAQLADVQGRFLVFASVGQLTADDSDNVPDIYRYDAHVGQLQRISSGRGGFGSDGNGAFASAIKPIDNRTSLASAGAETRTIEEDGRRVVFVTSEALEAGDVNDASDIYEWADGEVALVSDGEAPGGTAEQVLSFEKGLAISADGSTVAFSTPARLLPDRDRDEVSDVYVARLGADVEDPVPARAGVACAGDACQPSGPPLKPLPLAGSVTFVGPGNVLSPVAPSPAGGKVAVERPKAVRGTRVVLTVDAPGAGRLAVTGKSVASSTRRSTKAGRYRVAVSLRARTRKALARRGTVKARVSVTFTPTLGASSRSKLTLTFKAVSRKGRS